jgi:hypothetical protein
LGFALVVECTPYTVLITFFFAGKWKRFYGKRKILSHKRRNYKTALVYYDKAPETKA